MLFNLQNGEKHRKQSEKHKPRERKAKRVLFVLTVKKKKVIQGWRVEFSGIQTNLEVDIYGTLAEGQSGEREVKGTRGARGGQTR